MTEQTSALAHQQTPGTLERQDWGLSVKAVKARVAKIRQIQQEVMKPDVHYGTIPGTAKPTLYKPGTELLGVTFELASEHDVEDLSGIDSTRYRVRTRLRHVPSGMIVGEGVGEASSDEEKYRWRRAVCKEEWEATEPDRRREKYARAKGGGHYTIQQIRTEVADVSNTILKMAKKRAHSDAILATLAASDIFDQDLEDLPEEIRAAGATGSPRVSKPKEKAPEKDVTPAAPEPSDSNPELDEIAKLIPAEAWEEVRSKWHDKGTVSEPQRKRLIAIAKTESGWEPKEVTELIRVHFGVTPDEIPWGQCYDALVTIFQSVSPNR